MMTMYTGSPADRDHKMVCEIVSCMIEGRKVFPNLDRVMAEDIAKFPSATVPGWEIQVERDKRFAIEIDPAKFKVICIRVDTINPEDTLPLVKAFFDALAKKEPVKAPARTRIEFESRVSDELWKFTNALKDVYNKASESRGLPFTATRSMPHAGVAVSVWGCYDTVCNAVSMSVGATWHGISPRCRLIVRRFEASSFAWVMAEGLWNAVILDLQKTVTAIMEVVDTEREAKEATIQDNFKQIR